MKQRFLFLCFLLFLTAETFAQPALVPYRLYTKWGFADMTGKLVIPAKYDMVTQYQGKCAVVKLKGKYGLINDSGKLVQPVVYDYIDYKQWQNNIWYTLRAGKKQGVTNFIGQLVLPVKFDDLKFDPRASYIMGATGTNYEKLAADGAAAKATRSEWEKLNGMESMISAAPYTDLVQPFTQNNKKGYLIRKRTRPGYDTIPAIYDDFDESHFYENVLWAKKDGLWGVIGPKNNIVFPFLYEEVADGSVEYNLYAGKKNGKCGILNSNGDVLVPFEWDKLGFSNDGFWARISKNEKTGIVILDGNTPVFIPAKYKKAVGNPVIVIEYESRKFRFFDVETGQGYGYVREDGMEYFKDK